MEINLCKNEAEVFSCGFNVFDLCKFFSPRLILSAKFSRIFLSHSTPSGFQSFFKTFLNGMVKADNSLSASNSEETTLSKSFVRILGLAYPSLDNLLNYPILWST